MIAVERPAALPEIRLERSARARSAIRTKTPVLTRLSSAVLLVALISSLGGLGLVDSGSAYVLQGRASALHAHWAFMRANGIPDSDLAELEGEWTLSQQTRVVGAGSTFWLPGGAETLNRWQVESDAIWARDLSRYSNDAAIAEMTLHKALGAETLVQRKARLEALALAATPLDYATLRADWSMEARLVPIDARIAAAAGSVVGQTQQARQLGIRSEPAGDILAGADAYSLLDPAGRMARAELLTRGLLSVQKGLQGRLDAATITSQNFQNTNDQISLAALYGIDISSYQTRITADHNQYGRALTVAEFNTVTEDLKQISAAADNGIYTVMSQTHIVSGVAFYYQNHPLSCEEAATSMALTHQGIYVSQDQILNEIGADLRGMYVDSQGRVRWGNPYETFVGNVNGSESNYTGFGTYYPPLVRVAKAHGAHLLAYGSMSAATIYARVIAGHPVVAFATWDWRWHPRRDYLSYDGQWVPWIGPVYASHVYTVVGVSPSDVLVNDPIRGQYWISKGAFEAGYSDFNEAIVFA
jgi:uncharacterized protein YvpB